MALTVGPRLQGFFDEVLPAILTTLNDRGTPEMTPVWYEFADGQIWLNGDKTRSWLDRMEKTGRSTFLVMDPTNFWRWVQVYGRSSRPATTRAANTSTASRTATVARIQRQSYLSRKLEIEITSVKGADGSPTRDRWDVSG